MGLESGDEIWWLHLGCGENSSLSPGIRNGILSEVAGGVYYVDMDGEQVCVWPPVYATLEEAEAARQEIIREHRVKGA